MLEEVSVRPKCDRFSKWMLPKSKLTSKWHSINRVKMIISKLTFTNTDLFFRAQMLHLETENMMTKYQIVYSKLETCLVNLDKTSELYNRQSISRGFHKMAQNAANHKQVTADRKRLVGLKFD